MGARSQSALSVDVQAPDAPRAVAELSGSFGIPCTGGALLVGHLLVTRVERVRCLLIDADVVLALGFGPATVQGVQ